VPVRSELQLGVKQLDARLFDAVNRTLVQLGHRLEGLARGLPKPAHLLDTMAQRLDDWSERLLAALPASLERRQQQLAMLASHLKPQLLLNEVMEFIEHLTELARRMNECWRRGMEKRAEKLQALASLLESVNYKKVLERGFVL